eukprot:CAMPEP_0183741506 /NCGR_PEP_ID=MMETSP0737-20130205/62279_1 /TAXON_ID=385413 /ORGANISM="Thalassiosira miniscula, Strain CCMP1093" /LENGTH=367 /DNA_ID=CAMNT_0025976853 /DNA_START=284 /DNA_END=1387 /DNA_ORIENTATION=+
MATFSNITKQIINNIVQWASELNTKAEKDLTQCEQVRVWNDLSGDEGRRRTFGADGKELFSDVLYEPADLVRDALTDLTIEMEKLPRAQRKALDRALKLSPEYVMNRSFCLKFLRAEQFDARLAAVRMALHFEEKLILFGEEKLTREIMLSDLDKDDIDCLNTGYLQVLKELDFGNRKVIFYYKAVSDCYKQRENLLRSFWYVMNTISAGEDVQKLGVVNVVYNLCGFPEKGMDYEKSRRIAKLVKAIPVRFCSFYPCIDSRAWAVVVDTFSVLVSKYLRFRFRVIKGDHEWVLLKLKSIGIPSEALPVTGSGELLVEDHMAWIQDCKMKEETAFEPPCKRSRAVRENKVGVTSGLIPQGGFKDRPQ